MRGKKSYFWGFGYVAWETVDVSVWVTSASDVPGADIPVDFGVDGEGKSSNGDEG